MLSEQLKLEPSVRPIVEIADVYNMTESYMRTKLSRRLWTSVAFSIWPSDNSWTFSLIDLTKSVISFASGSKNLTPLNNKKKSSLIYEAEFNSTLYYIFQSVRDSASTWC